MVVTMANVAAPTSAKVKANHVDNLAGNSFRTSNTVPRPVHPSRTKAVSERSFQPRETPLPVIRPLVIRKVTASKQTRIPAPVSYIGKSSGVRPTLQGSARGKPMLDKALPSKPMFRPTDSPERRGVLDATDMNSKNLDARFPPLEPTNSSEASNPVRVSPSADSFVITPSLASSNQSGGSKGPELIEYGMAQSASILPIRNPHLDSVGCIHSEKSPAGYRLSAPGSLEQRPLRQDNQVSDGSPSRSSRRTSKYGIAVRESLDARDIIMGGGEDQKGGKNGIERRPSRFGSVNLSGSRRARNAPAETPIPPVPEIPASFTATSPRPSSLLPRMSSLPMSSDFSEVKDSNYATKSKNNAADTVSTAQTFNPQNTCRNFNNTPVLASSSKLPRQSLSARQTSSKAARESTTSKKDSKAGGLASDVSQFRSVSSLSNISFSNVSSGMKRLGKKVANIIPSRRAAKTIAASASMAELQATPPTISKSTSDPSHDGQTSRPLTTYKNSSMNVNTSAADGSPICRGAIGNEPTDKHVTDEIIRDKEDWELAQDGLVYDGDRLIYFGAPPNRRGAPIGAGDDDEPPDTPPIRDGQDGHYVERTDDEGSPSPVPEATGAEEPVNQLTPASAMRNNNSAVPQNSPASPMSAGNGWADSSTVAAANIPSGLNPAVTGEMAYVLEDAELVTRGLMEQALSLEPGPFRTQIALAAERLGELVINLREARMISIRVNQSLDELSATVANGGVRMSALVEAYLAERG